MSLTAQQLDSSPSSSGGKAKGEANSSSTNAGTSPSSSTAVPVFDFEPVKKTTIDLFSRAPQVKKLTRREKAKLRQEVDVAAALQQKKAKKSVKGAKGTGEKDDITSTAAATLAAASPDGLFATVFSSEEIAQELAAQREAKASQLKKKNKKQILRHALHPNVEEDQRTAFVGNLPNTITKREVERIFKDCGKIESVRVRCQVLEEAKEKSRDVGRAVRVLRGEIRKDERFSATAYVLFEDEAGVKEALKKSGVVFLNRHLVVSTMDAEGRAYPPATSIFLGNLAYDTTEEQVWNFFVDKGVADVKRVRLVRDRETGDCKGFGYVEFINASSVKPAIETRGSMLNNRELRIVHVNKSKDATSATASRREKRRQGGRDDGGSARDRSLPSRGGRGGKRGREERDTRGGEKRAREEKSSTPSWMGVTTNPRRKMPRDLRPLVDGKRDGPAPPRAPVKRKMRNPEK